jgi:hypothetical protein
MSDVCLWVLSYASSQWSISGIADHSCQYNGPTAACTIEGTYNPVPVGKYTGTGTITIAAPTKVGGG